MSYKGGGVRGTYVFVTLVLVQYGHISDNKPKSSKDYKFNRTLFRCFDLSKEFGLQDIIKRATSCRANFLALNVKKKLVGVRLSPSFSSCFLLQQICCLHQAHPPQ